MQTYLMLFRCLSDVPEVDFSHCPVSYKGPLLFIIQGCRPAIKGSLDLDTDGESSTLQSCPPNGGSSLTLPPFIYQSASQDPSLWPGPHSFILLRLSPQAPSPSNQPLRRGEQIAATSSNSWALQARVSHQGRGSSPLVRAPVGMMMELSRMQGVALGVGGGHYAGTHITG